MALVVHPCGCFHYIMDLLEFTFFNINMVFSSELQIQEFAVFQKSSQVYSLHCKLVDFISTK